MSKVNLLPLYSYMYKGTFQALSSGVATCLHNLNSMATPAQQDLFEKSSNRMSTYTLVLKISSRNHSDLKLHKLSRYILNTPFDFMNILFIVSNPYSSYIYIYRNNKSYHMSRIKNKDL